MTTLKLKKNKRFVEQTICFGTSETFGNYQLKGDTIFFENVKPGRGQPDYYKFAVIRQPSFKSEKIIGDFVRYRSETDSIGYPLWITKNELNQ
jgi:hypothetical protein